MHLLMYKPPSCRHGHVLTLSRASSGIGTPLKKRLLRSRFAFLKRCRVDLKELVFTSMFQYFLHLMSNNKEVGVFMLHVSWPSFEFPAAFGRVRLFRVFCG